MDQATFRAYAAHAGEIARRHAMGRRALASISQYFARAFAPGDRILDIGAGRASPSLISIPIPIPVPMRQLRRRRNRSDDSHQSDHDLMRDRGVRIKWRDSA